MGEVEEEEPEGEVVAGPTGKATTHDSGIMSFLFIYIYIFLLIHVHAHIYTCI